MSLPPNSYAAMQQQQHQQQQHATNTRIKMVDGYALQQKLGSGSFATVYKGIKMPTQHQHQQQDGSSADEGPTTVAIKAITRTSEKLTKKVLQNLEIEISILRSYRHPNIVCMHNVQKTERHFYLILEYCGGGDVQRLIRTRKAGRLSEGLTRRLTRDLASGLKFLWGQELIHRDIKPQNLLLTGALPLDELNDPERTPQAEELRRQANFPSAQFSLKIADFGFARHLQSASLAETLCGSPLYMAPEILQHHRYDAKADLWSVGTVLFEMITGKPPFNGENHIDLLRNIQRNSVRLPKDVRVTKPCVNILRVLLNRNPLSRAGFKEFFEAADAFVALGCKGVATTDTGTCRKTIAPSSSSPSNPPAAKDLGTIPEDDGASGSDSLMTVATTAQPMPQQQHHHHPHLQHQQQQHHQLYVPQSTPTQVPNTSQAPLVRHVVPQQQPAATPAPFISQPGYPPNMHHIPPNQRNRLTPLQPSPPGSVPSVFSNVRIPTIPSLPPQSAGVSAWQAQGARLPMNALPRVEFSQMPAGAPAPAADEGSFVMVDRDIAPRNDPFATQLDGSGIAMTVPHQQQGMLIPNRRMMDANAGSNAPARYMMNTPAVVSGRAEYSVPPSNQGNVSRGILSTSPGTGGLLMGLVGRMPQRLGYTPSSPTSSTSPPRLDIQLATANKLLATAEDVGRRAISVAHLGDTRAFLAMRLLVSGGESSSMLSSMPMEGVIEEPADAGAANIRGSSNGNVSDSGSRSRGNMRNDDNKNATGDDDDSENGSKGSSSTEVMSSTRRRSSISERAMADAKKIVDEEAEEMPFAIGPEAAPVSLPSRQSHSMYSTSKPANSKPPQAKATPSSIRAHFAEALSCYLKALRMIKSAVSGAQKVGKEYEILSAQMGNQNVAPPAPQSSPASSSPPPTDFAQLMKRCEVTTQWLSGQFKGVLERADASQTEINKMQMAASNRSVPATTPMGIEELIYNHSLACGREGAVKQLLGQHEAARSCYRSAGLLIETLMMEQSITKSDRKILEEYVDGFAVRINEVDQLMMQQSRMATSVTSSRRGSGIVGLIAPPPAAPSFLVSPTLQR